MASEQERNCGNCGWSEDIQDRPGCVGCNWAYDPANQTPVCMTVTQSYMHTHDGYGCTCWKAKAPATTEAKPDEQPAKVD